MNGCPHSNSPSADPRKCSLCLGATARPVTYNAATRELRVGGEVQERTTDHESITKAPPNKGVKASRNGKRQKTCGQCGKTGHNRAKCSGQEASSVGTEAMALADREEAA